MKLLSKIGAFFVLCSSATVFAATLNIPMAFKYIAVDGKKVSSSIFKHKSDLKLGLGHHEIAIQYKDMVENDISDTETQVTSTAFIVSLNVSGDYRYILKPAGGSKIKDPQQFAKSPDVIIVRGDKGSVDYTVTHTDITKKSFSTRLYNNDASTQMQPASATTQQTAVLASDPVTATELPARSAAVVSTGAEGGDAQQMLQHWWLQADEKTRKEFLGWAIKQL